MPKSYHSYTVQFKVSVVDWHNANGANLSKTSREFEIDRKRIREWMLQGLVNSTRRTTSDDSLCSGRVPKILLR